jgi:hypothetical protein
VTVTGVGSLELGLEVVAAAVPSAAVAAIHTTEVMR